MRSILVTGIFVFSLICMLKAQPGSYDLTYNFTGKVITTVGSFRDNARASVQQSDGKVIVAGYACNDTALNKFALMRINTDGSLDNTFDGDGKVITSIGTGNDEIYDIALQADGKIVVVGFSEGTTAKDFAVARYNSNGTLDASFDSDGIVTTAIGVDYDVAFAVAIQSDGKIVASGAMSNGSNYDYAVVRYNTNGTLDNSFDGDGIVSTGIGPNSDYGYDVIIQPDLKIVVAGNLFNGRDHDFCVARYNSDGSLDNSFSGDGKVITPIKLDHDYGYAAVLQDDGKILLAGQVQSSAKIDFGVVRYNADGSLDSTFSSDGIVTTEVTTGSDFAMSMVVQNDNKIVVAGYTYFEGDMAMTRYNADGSYDNTFSYDGRLNFDFNNSYAGINDILIQPDGKYVVCGFYSDSFTSQTRMMVARLNSECTAVNTMVTQSGTTLSASLLGASYQWIDCSSGSLMPGDTSAVFTALANGNYAVIIDQNGCVDTSNCLSITTVSTSQLYPVADSYLFPNPSSGIINFHSNGNVHSVQVFDVNSCRVFETKVNEMNCLINLSMLSKGLYFVKWLDETGQQFVSKLYLN